MKARLAIATALFGTLVAAPAFAQESASPLPALPPTEVEAPAPPAKISLGAQIEVLPGGQFTLRTSHGSDTAALKTAFGLGLVFGVDVTPNISVGAAPRVILDIEGENGNGDALKEFDLRGRAAVHGEIAPEIAVYGFLEPGYSWITSPKVSDSLTGAVVAFGAGFAYDVDGQLYVNAELGYQLGFQGEDVQGEHADEQLDFFHLGVGGGTRF